jgi:hypothetical protein
VLTPSFDALAASQQSADGDSVTFDVTPAPVLPMAPWPPSSRNAGRAQPETTVRILRTSAVREGLVAIASFFVVCVIGFGVVFFFGDALHLTHRTVDQPAPPATTAEPPRRP